MLFLIQSFIVGIIWLECAVAVKLFANATLPADITTFCSNALLRDTSCDIAITFFDPAGYYDQDLLERVCTDECTSSLKAFEEAVVGACDMQNFGGEENWDLTINPTFPIAMIPNKLRFNYGLACLKDNDRFCNVVAAEAAAESNQDGTPSDLTRSNPRNSSQIIRQATISPCDQCFIKMLQYEAAGPYYDGPYIREESIYQTLTSSCSVQNLPPTTWTLPYSTKTTPTDPVPTCGGKTYNINPGDTCYSISKSQSIGTEWLLTDNSLLAGCVNFPTEGPLCIKNTCNIYEVQPGDTCNLIADSYNLTVPQLQAWNLALNKNCGNIATMNGTQICLSNPGTVYTTPSTTIINPTTATTAAPVPEKTGEGSNPRCGEWHVATEGEYCNILTYKYHISLPDFIFLNPSINENCTNLWADYAYCVQPVGDINTYSGRPGFSTMLPTPITTLDWNSLPDATYTTPPPSTTPPPLANGVRGDCTRYFLGSDFPDGLELAIGSISACQRAVNAYGINLDDLQNWNVGLNASAPDCAFQPDVRYCGQWYSRYVHPKNIEGAIENCSEYVSVTLGWNCQNILDTYGITIAQFFEWNPAVGADCGNLWTNYRYCVSPPGGVTPTASGTTPTPTQTGVATPSPVQDGQPANCNAWYKAVAGDGCWSIANTAFITLDQFYEWNPAVGSDCSNGIWLNYYYCVGTTNNPQPTRSSNSVTPTPTSGPAAPSPTQDNNIISSCNKFDKAVDGDACWSFANRNEISLEQLGTWNSLLKPDGSGCAENFWLNYYYCVGVAT
ncbi:hypothetical protein CC78DRAFT_522009 [Lojkania enalia]|uniref:LysM domain-containing protein n=1 Tax=Lojkania enalia TaxID=147567 RepID=A0A9P4K4S7_9PLEO|nr:hypothetical protein CC78DRAFT_522009 [Didymosphaeria enalia]